MRPWFVIVLAGLVAIVSVFVASALTSGGHERSLRAAAGAAPNGFELSWFSVDGGGQMPSCGGGFDLSGTMGQPDAGSMAGGAFALTGGFWIGQPLVTSGVVEPADGLSPQQPLVFRLLPNFPNPFNTATHIAFDLPSACRVRVDLYSLRGRLVRNLLDEERPAGRHLLRWDGKDNGGGRAASGVYLVRLRAEGFEDQRKLMLVR